MKPIETYKKKRITLKSGYCMKCGKYCGEMLVNGICKYWLRGIPR